MRKVFQLVFAGAATILLTSAAEAQKPSFSCRGVHRCPEITVCATPELARLDSIMAGLYFSLQGLASRPEARALLANQRAWLAERDDCGCNASCLFAVYRERIRDLRTVTDMSPE